MKEQNSGEYTYFAGVGDGSSNICNSKVTSRVKDIFELRISVLI
jgi:hypothetical protein